MAISLDNKSRTYRSSLDCQQNKSETWQSHIPAESADKHKPIDVCVRVQTLHSPSRLLLRDVGSYLQHRTTDVHHLFYFIFFLLAQSAPRMRG